MQSFASPKGPLTPGACDTSHLNPFSTLQRGTLFTKFSLMVKIILLSIACLHVSAIVLSQYVATLQKIENVSKDIKKQGCGDSVVFDKFDDRVAQVDVENVSAELNIMLVKGQAGDTLTLIPNTNNFISSVYLNIISRYNKESLSQNANRYCSNSKLKRKIIFTSHQDPLTTQFRNYKIRNFHTKLLNIS